MAIIYFDNGTTLQTKEPRKVLSDLVLTGADKRLIVGVAGSEPPRYAEVWVNKITWIGDDKVTPAPMISRFDVVIFLIGLALFVAAITWRAIAG